MVRPVRVRLTSLSRPLRAWFSSSVRPPSDDRADDHADDRLRIAYQPDLNGDADPGEIVWTWVAYEDDPDRGKDRPVLLVGRIGEDLAGLMLTSKDHDRDAADEARWGRVWMDIGPGDWDARRRPSEVRLDRLLRVDPAKVRREGSVVDRAMFDRVVAAMVTTRGDRSGW